MDPKEPRPPANRLAHERSPYLLQHAHNPVDWHPWGDEAFEKARREDKPVFLSVGYSACHWCHVMEHESFEDEATARYLNERFVSVKVDREERPDVDQIYQLAHQVLTQRGGGWPLSVFLTPSRKPFFAGTYFPNGRRHGMPSFVEVLAAVDAAWRDKRADVDAQADELTSVLGRVTSARPDREGDDGRRAPLDARGLAEGAAVVLRRADRTWGGFGRAPKFPNTMTLDVLLAAASALGHGDARDHALTTLDRMARGGMYDHLGGGFARYSTDERWHVPHFEKMLYDNALLARLYLDGWRVLSDGDNPALRERCRAVVGETLAYVLREMTDATGAFYSAQDADSEGEEGRFFVWTPDTLAAALGPDDATTAGQWFDVTREGNWEHGASVLWTPRPLAQVAAALGTAPAALAEALGRIRARLFEAREARVHPARDDKSLAAWNALMISALADAGATLAQPAWIDAARAALDAWRTRAWQGGRLRHAMKHGEAYGEGFLDDHAGLADAALDVYEATFAPDALAFARALADAALARFRDEATGEFCYTPADGEVVLHRTRDPHDNAYPGGVGLVARALLRLGELTGHAPYRDAAAALLAPLAGLVRENPMGLGTVALATDRLARGAVEVIVMGDLAREDTRAMLHAARAVHLPHRALVCARDADEGATHGLDPALLEGRSAGPGGGPVAFVCRGTACEMPVREPEALVATLRRAVRG